MASAAKSIRLRIEAAGPNRLWTYSDFQDQSLVAVATALRRMVQAGKLERVRKGVYYAPAENRFGRTAPDAIRVANAVLSRRGLSYKVSGLPGYNALGLTTQLSPVLTIDVESRLSSLRTGFPTRIKIRSGRPIRDISDDERIALDALREIRSIPDSDPVAIFKRIEELTRSGRLNYDRMAGAASPEPPRVRALMGLLGSRLNAEAAVLLRLRSTLNPTTVYKLGLDGAIPEARDWNIR